MTNSSHLPVILLTLLSACDGGSAPELPALPPRRGEVEAAPAGEPQPLRELILAVTSEVRGEIEPCGCPTVPYGGFGRRERFLAGLRAGGVPVFVLDTGEMLVKGEAGSDPDRDRRARLVLDLARGTGLDAWSPGLLDLVPGGVELLAGTGALSANWRRGGAPVLPGSTVIERGGMRLGVVGLSGGGGREFSLAEAVGATAAEVEAGGADVWVALSNLSTGTTREVAGRVPGLGVVLSVSGESHDPPVATALAPVVEIPERGRFVSVLRVYLGAAPGPLTVVEGSPWAAYGAEQARVRSLAEGVSRTAGEAHLLELRAAVEAATLGKNVMTVEHRPLGSELDEGSTLQARIDAWKGQAARAAQSRASAPSSAPEYSTAGSCASCHRRHFAQWTVDPHKSAWQALTARERGTDVECVGCHTTGFGEPGGFGKLTAENLANWNGVQCAACHGPMSGHPQDPHAHSRPVTLSTCTGCHDEANSPAFDARTYRPKISCAIVAAGAGE